MPWRASAAPGAERPGRGVRSRRGSSDVRSSEPSSMTRIRRCLTGIAISRATLSAIVTSSLSAGTRNTQLKPPAPSGGYRRRRRAAPRGLGRTAAATTTGRCHDQQADREQPLPRPSQPLEWPRQHPAPAARAPSLIRGFVDLFGDFLGVPSWSCGSAPVATEAATARVGEVRLELVSNECASASKPAAARSRPVIAGAERCRRCAAAQEVFERRDDSLRRPDRRRRG